MFIRLKNWRSCGTKKKQEKVKACRTCSTRTRVGCAEQSSRRTSFKRRSEPKRRLLSSLASAIPSRSFSSRLGSLSVPPWSPTVLGSLPRPTKRAPRVSAARSALPINKYACPGQSSGGHGRQILQKRREPPKPRVDGQHTSATKTQTLSG